MRTNEIEALKGWKDTCSYWTQKTPCAPTHSMKLLPNSTFGTVIWKTRNACEWQEWLDLWSLRELYHTLSLLRARWIQVCPGFTQKLCDFCRRNGSVVIQTHACITLTICLWNRTRSRHLEPGRRKTAWESTKPSTYVVFYLPITNHENDFDSNSIALQEKGWCWSTMSATSHQKHENAAYYMFLHSDSRVFRESFDNIVVQYGIIKSVWTAAMNFNDVDLFVFRTTSPFGTRRQRNCSQPPCGKVTKPSMYVVFYLQTKNHEIDFDTRFLGKGQCWATMSATSLQKHQNAATTLLESGSIWPDSVRLQDVILTPTCLRCFHVSHHEKCAKANLPMLLSLSPCKRLKRTNCHSWVMEQSGLIVQQLSSRRNASLWQFLHVFHEPTSSPAIQTFSVTLAICGWNPSQSDHFEPSVLPPYGKMWSVPNMYAIFCWQNNDENDFDSNSVARQEKRQCWCPMSGTSLQTMRKAVPKSPDSDTWRVERVLGSIWRSIVTLQNVRLTVTSPLLQYH